MIVNPLIQFSRRYETAIWLTLIMVLVFYLRFKGLTFQSYWFDELFSAYFSNPEHSLETVVKLTLADVHPPVYQLMMWLSYQLFGYTEWAGRLPSAIAGVLTVPAMYLLGRELFNSRVGLYAAALAVPNYYLLYYAQEARSYALLYFLCSLSFLYFLRVINSASRLNLVFYIAATLTLLYTHYFGFVLVIAQGLIFVIYIYSTGWPNRPLVTRAVIAAGTIALVVAPLAPIIARHSAINDFWIPQPETGFLIHYFQAYFNSGLIAVGILLLICVAIGGALLKQSSRQIRFGIVALLVWVAVGYLLPWLRGFTGQPVITDRNTIMLVPPILLLAACGLNLIPKAWLQRFIGAVLLAYSFYYLFFTVDYYGQVRKNQYREITQAMSAFEPALPVYTLNHNEEKYNVYFIQQASPLLVKDAGILGTLLEGERPPSLFWLAGGHRYTPKADPGKQYGLIEVGRYAYKGTAAALLVNPAVATPLTLERVEADEAVYVSALLPTPRSSLKLLIAINEQNQQAFTGVIQLELLNELGDVAYSEAVTQVAVPTILTLGPEQGAVSLKITLTTDEFAPTVWLIPAGRD